MNETTLLKIALICSIIGLVALYFISSNIEIGDYRPALSKSGDDVKLKGTISKISKKDNTEFIVVSQQSDVNVVAFTNGKNSELKENDKIEIDGKVQEYNRKEEIVAEKILVIK